MTSAQMDMAVLRTLLLIGMVSFGLAAVVMGVKAYRRDIPPLLDGRTVGPLAVAWAFTFLAWAIR